MEMKLEVFGAERNRAFEQLAILTDERTYLMAGRRDPIRNDLGEINDRLREIEPEIKRLKEMVGW